jgi:hypothetical protein
MTDQDPLEGRLSRWFAQEVRRAERDLATRPATPALRHRRASGLPVAFSVLGLAVAVGAIAVFQLPVDPARPSTGPALATRAPLGPASSPPAIGVDDSIPATIDGEPVLGVAEARERAAAATSRDPFLVGGVASHLRRRCAPLLLECPGLVLESPDPLAYSVQVLVAADGLVIPAGPVVLRVHAADPRADECAEARRETCRRTLVAEAVVWPGPPVAIADGVPVDIGGQPVLSVPEARELMESPGASGSLLVAGTVTPVTYDCTPLAPDQGFACPGWTLRGNDRSWFAAFVFGAWAPASGRVVARVHDHDPAAERCSEDVRRACREMPVLDAVVWVAPESITARASDGLPSEIGSAPVIRPSGFDAMRLEPGEQRAVAGWVAECHVAGCAQPILGDTPIPDAGSLVLVESAERLSGPAVVLVERATGHVCTDEPCRSQVQVVAILWMGGDLMAADPLGIYDVVPVLREATKTTGMEAVGASLDGCPVPPQTWRLYGDPRIDAVAVYEDTEARMDAEREPACLGPTRLMDRIQWLSFGNGMVRVRLRPGGQDEAFRADLWERLSAIVPG